MEAIIHTPIGNLRIVENDNALVEAGFTDLPIVEITENALLESVRNQMTQYFEGRLENFDLPLNPSGTEFQQLVWQQLLGIPYGTTISYQEMAKRLGDPKTIRAAASANGQNPLAIVIPCHRVIGTNGEMTGYAGGIQRKKDLLKLEGAAVMNQMNLF